MNRAVRIAAIVAVILSIRHSITHTSFDWGRRGGENRRKGRFQDQHCFLTIIVDTVDCQLCGISGCAGSIGGNASVSARVTRARRIYGQQAVPLGSGHGHMMILLDRHSIQRPRDL